MKSQSVSGLDPANWTPVTPPFRCSRVQIVTDVNLLFKGQASDVSITLYAGAPNTFDADFTPSAVAFHLKPLSGSPEPGLIWS